MEKYYEESAISQTHAKEDRNFQIFHVICLIFAAIAVILIGFSWFMVPDLIKNYTGGQLVWMLVQQFAPLVGALLAAALFYFLKFKFGVSYDYLLIEDELRVSKVFNGKKRKFLYRFKSDFVLKVGFCERESYEKTLLGNGKPIFLTPNKTPSDGKIFIYLLYSDSNGKYVYVFECRETFMERLAFMVGRNKVELQ